MENISDRIKKIRVDFFNDKNTDFAKALGENPTTTSNWISGKRNIGLDVVDKIIQSISGINIEWLITGNGDMLKEDSLKSKEEMNLIKSDLKKETRIRIPLNAAAGSISVALDGVTSEDCENLPVIESFAKYNYTILVKGDSMEPEFHSGDELACLFINGKSSFVQWGNFHVLDTSQGIIVKRIYDDDEYILCVSENNQLFKEFRIHKSEIYSISLVIGMLRRF